MAQDDHPPPPTVAIFDHVCRDAKRIEPSAKLMALMEMEGGIRLGENLVVREPLLGIFAWARSRVNAHQHYSRGTTTHSSVHSSQKTTLRG